MEEERQILDQKPSQKGPFQETSVRPIYSNNWIQVTEHRVNFPNGEPGLFGIVKMADGITVLPFVDKKTVLLSTEYKFAAESDSIEAFSGAIEIGESPLQAARRELREESGMDAKNFFHVTKIEPFPTLIKSTNHIFFATNLFSSPLRADPSEVISVSEKPLDEAVDMVLAGNITHAASCLAIILASRDNAF